MRSTVSTCVMSLALIAVAGVSLNGCLRRPVVAGEPTTTTNFTQQLATKAVDKIDLLFAIDNSASMGDKQAYLEQAIPSLVSRLVTPYCVDDADGVTLRGQSQPSATGGDPTCPAGSELEFPSVHDMHIGIVSSSLGSRLGDALDGNNAACRPNTPVTIGGVTLDRHNDDSGHLLTRSSTLGAGPPTETALADAQEGFLAWFPTATENTGKDAGAPAVVDVKHLEDDFSDLVAGVHEYGCGIESQLESWYRFLIQPDPYASLALDTNRGAQWVGVDTTILKQRHDFLRPDSLVAIIVLSDENDSEIDVRSLGGKGYEFMAGSWSPPRGTAACATNPDDPSCHPCPDAGASSDPECEKGGYAGATDWGNDLNLRHVHMPQKYGQNPQFPMSRYVDGLTSPTVPNRDGEYPSGATSYTGTANCQNPLFARDLPDGTALSKDIATAYPLSAADAKALCDLTPSTSRPKSLVFFAIIGGVPHQLLHFDPNSASNSELKSDDWRKILGNDPDHYDYSGIDYHMVESYQPRTGLANIAPLTGDETAAQAPGTGVDPWNGGEWITDGVITSGPQSGAPLHVDLPVDRQYACTFALTGPPRDCSNQIVGGVRVWTVPENGFACDCSSTGLSAGQTSPVCDRANPTNQIAAKAYPTIRELDLAHKLGAQGIVSSICPIDVSDNATKDDPLYGYRPAVAAIVNRLKGALTNTCLPHALSPDPATGNIPCLILATLASTSPANANNPEADCNDPKYPGLEAPDADTLAEFVAQAHASWRSGGAEANGEPDPATLPTCAVKPLPASALTNGSCKASSAQGWCYVDGSAAGACDQAILFSPQTLPAGARVNLQCLETRGNDGGG